MAERLMFRLLMLVWIATMAVTAVPLPVWASIHTYHERPGQTTVRSQQSLRDRNDQAWQAIAFKRYRPDGLEGLYLRLVGFPGAVTIAPQRPLLVDTGTTLSWQAPVKLDPLTPALPDNTNQYDGATFMADLEKDIPLILKVPLQGRSDAELVVPPYVVHEWRQLVNQAQELAG